MIICGYWVSPLNRLRRVNPDTKIWICLRGLLNLLLISRLYLLVLDIKWVFMDSHLIWRLLNIWRFFAFYFSFDLSWWLNEFARNLAWGYLIILSYWLRRLRLINARDAWLVSNLNPRIYFILRFIFSWWLPFFNFFVHYFILNIINLI